MYVCIYKCVCCRQQQTLWSLLSCPERRILAKKEFSLGYRLLEIGRFVFMFSCKRFRNRIERGCIDTAVPSTYVLSSSKRRIVTHTHSMVTGRKCYSELLGLCPICCRCSGAGTAILDFCSDHPASS